MKTPIGRGLVKEGKPTLASIIGHSLFGEAVLPLLWWLKYQEPAHWVHENFTNINL